MIVVRFAKFWLALGALFMVASIVSIMVFGVKLSIEFTGGSLVEFDLLGNPEVVAVRQAIEQNTDVEIASLVDFEDGYVLRAGRMTQEQYEELSTQLSIAFDTEEVSKADVVDVKKFSSIGPSVGSQLARRAILAIGLSLIAIIVYVGWIFRNISYPLPSWMYSLATLISLAHDILIPTGIFAYLTHRGVTEINTLYVIAMLSILGASVNDTIVTFDRIRDNVRLYGGGDYPKIIAKSIEETWFRSMGTSLTLLIVLGSVYVYSEASIRFFSLALFLGILFGSYSSLFVASPILLILHSYRSNKSKK
jgi:preprotein translocase subunit SecF